MQLITSQGPIVGHVSAVPRDSRKLRVYAPARLMTPSATTVAYLPIFGIEKYIDLTRALIFGEAPVPAVLLAGYQGYFDSFAEGAYQMKPIVAAVKTEGPTHSVDLKPPAAEAATEESEDLEDNSEPIVSTGAPSTTNGELPKDAEA